MVSRTVGGMATARRIWSHLVYIALDPWVALLALIPLVVGASVAAGLAITVVGGIAALAVTLAACRLMSGWERQRVNALLGTDIAPLPPLPPGDGSGWWARTKRQFGSPSWKAFGYWWIKQVTAPVAFALVIAAWAGGLALVAMPAYRSFLPNNTANLLIAKVTHGSQQIWAILAGVLILLLAPVLTLAFGQMHASIARSLLSPGRVAELEAQVATVTERRDAAVDAAEAERRRIERDLHDGAQQRLVALAMSLGMAKEKFDQDPDAARSLLDEAHGEAKAAMTELRNIARGIHPAVLSDRGLDAALSGLVARAPIPVGLTVSVGERRLPDPVEGAAYYVVAEALTNIAKHSQATRASVTLARQGDRLVISVTDDGVGGANARPGGGLAGLGDRVRSLGGFLHLSSPVGGPTNLLVELSCAA